MRVLQVAILLSLAQAPMRAGDERLTIVPQLGHSGGVSCVALSPDGNRIISGDNTGSVLVWEAKTGRLLRTLQTESNDISAVALSADGHIAASATTKGIDIWDLNSGKNVRNITISSQLLSLALSAEGRFVLSGSLSGGPLRGWDVVTGKEFPKLPEAHFGGTTSVALSDDAAIAISGGLDNTVRMWDLKNGRETWHSQPEGMGYIWSVDLSSDGRTAVWAGSSGIGVWDGHQVRKLMEKNEDITSVSISGDGNVAVSLTSGFCELDVWDLRTGAHLRSLDNSTDFNITHVVISRDSHIAIGASLSRMLHVWDVDTGKEVRPLSGSATGVDSVVVSQDGHTALLGSEDGTLSVWNLSIGTQMITLHGHRGRITSIAPDASGHIAISGGVDRTVRVWDVVSGRQLHIFESHTDLVNSVAISSDGRIAASGGRDRTVRIWNLETGTEFQTFKEHGAEVSSVALSADGRVAVSGGWDDVLRVWDVPRGTEVCALRGHVQKILAVALSADGRTAVSGGWDGSLQIWDIPARTRRQVLQGNSEWVTSVALSLDGRVMASGTDKSIRVWDLEAGKELTRIVPEIAASKVAFVPGHPDRIALGCLDGTMRLWDTAKHRELVALLRSAGGESIAITPSGYYDASERGEDLIAFVVDGHASALQSFRGQRNIPAVLRRTIELGDEQRAIEEIVGENAKQIGELIPLVRIAPQESRPEGKAVPRRVAPRDAVRYRVPIYVRSNMGRITRIRSFVDEVLLADIPQNVKDTTLELAVNFAPGEHQLRVEVEDDKGLRSEDVISISVEAKLPRLFIVAAAASEYDPATRLATLKYAQNDVDRIVGAFQSKALFSETKVVTLGPMGKARATRETILEAIDNEFRDAQESDWLVLYVSGHGDEDDSGQFRFLPEGVEARNDGQIARAKTITGSELMSWVKAKHKVGRRYLIVDACYSGQLISKSAHALDSELQNALLQEGTVVITSGWADQKAKESKALEGSVLTRALTEAMQKGKPDDIGALSLTTVEEYIRDFIKNNGIPEQDPQIWKDPSFGAGPKFPFWLRPKTR